MVKKHIEGLPETAHPVKFSSVVKDAVGMVPPVPERLAAFMKGTKCSIPLSNDYDAFSDILTSGRH